MRLTPWEEERLLIFTAAELARRHRAAAIKLNAPEAIALICDAMLEAARAGAEYGAVAVAGRDAVRPTDVLPGVRELVDEVRLEVLVGDGTRLVVLLDPLAGDDGDDGTVETTGATGPGAVRLAPATPRPAAEGAALELTVRSESRRAVHISSHYPFDRVNARLRFDREAARGHRLDLPAGSFERWAPGETRVVRLVRFGGVGDAAEGGGTGDVAEGGGGTGS
jgi:urease subunit gamma/beta